MRVRERKGKCRWVWYFIIPGLLLGMMSCKHTQTKIDIPQLVKIVEVGQYGGKSSVSYPGKISAAKNVKLAFRVAGPLKKVLVSEGQHVRKGQLLAELDSRDYQLEFNATQAEYMQIKGESDRVIELYNRGSVSINEYDKAVAARKRITALYNAHRNALNDTRLRAPFDGYIQNKYFSAPEIINQGTPVLSMINDDYFEVNVDIPTGDFIRRKDFTGYYAVADAFPDTRLPLELIDINQGANYNQLFNARFRLKRDEVSGLAAGMSVTVIINFKPGTEDIIMIPVSALFQKEGDSYVWLYDEDDHTISKVPVQIRQLTKTGSALVRANLRSGEMIISAGVNELKNGQKVKPLPPVSATNVGGLL